MCALASLPIKYEYNITCLIRLLGELNELMQIKGLKQCHMEVLSKN